MNYHGDAASRATGRLLPSTCVQPQRVAAHLHPGALVAEPVFLDLLGGSGGVALAVGGLGLRTVPSFDIANGPEYDLGRLTTRLALRQQLRSGEFSGLFISPPGKIWAEYRRNVQNAARAEAAELVEVSLTLFIVALLRDA